METSSASEIEAALSLIAKGLFAEAEQLARAALAKGVDRARFWLAYTQEQQGRIDLAAANYRAVAAQDENFIHAQIRLALILYSSGQGDAALNLAAAVQKANPGEILSLSLLARAFFDRGMFNEADQTMIKLSRSPGFLGALGRYLRGDLNWRQGAADEFAVLKGFWPLYSEIARAEGWMERALSERDAAVDPRTDTHRPQIQIRSAPRSGPKTTLVSYGSVGFGESQEKLVTSALAEGEIDEAISWTDEDLKKTEFFRRHTTLLHRPRGSGYWVWKPYLILRELLTRPDGEVVVYHDSGRGGAYSFTRSVRDVVDWCIRDSRGMLPGALLTTLGPSRVWTKRDCFHFMGCDDPAYWEHPQTMGTMSIWRVSDQARSFVREWLANCLDPRIVSDHANLCGLPNLEGFLDHRHDQSVLTNLVVREKVYVPVYQGVGINGLASTLRPPA